jgi:hypothetical protein
MLESALYNAECPEDSPEACSSAAAVNNRFRIIKMLSPLLLKVTVQRHGGVARFFAGTGRRRTPRTCLVRRRPLIAKNQHLLSPPKTPQSSA